MLETKPDRLLIPVLSACNFVIGMGAFVIIGLIEPLGEDIGRTPAQAGQLMTVYALAYAVMSPVLVALTGQIGRRRVMTAAFVLFTIAAILAALAPGFGMLVLSRIVAAAGAGMFTPVAAAVAAALYAPDQRARVLAAVFFGLTIAQVAGVPAGSYIAYSIGWRYAFGVVIVLSLPCIWLIWTRVPAGLRFQPVRMSDLGQTLGDFRTMLAITFTGTFLGSTYVLYTYIAPLLSQTMGYGRDGITFILVMFGLGAVGGNILGGMLADRYGWHRTLTGLCFAQIALMPLFSLLPFSTPLLGVLSVVWAVSGWSFMAGQQMRLINFAGPRAPVVLALNAAAIYVGAAIGSAFGGLVLAQFGITSLGFFAGLAALLALIHLTISARRAPVPYTDPNTTSA
ncbi:Major facilitator superfamily protein [Sulfitobacter noctilucicola]|uniref:Putative MFS family arabinose efflux permease n=1 Tax=Sulfitobacter noctilucicola TaxID=1342301 RepID=A0A7W6Q494_9RHOB|nr:MFS transporter [Sulfitobacter noctilucicola]KIN64413.1 Major facilitator superfamily protein [Sulfitobacter noctilucicola]MBB4174428.1 putative MFS family arabinose efflux permease [Sulfitobacter noctilucicola]